jgi:hypothetical protein
VGEAIEKLESAGQAVKRYVDTNVAHRARENRASATVTDVERAMATIAEIFQRYYVLLTGAFLATLTPVIQQDWKGPFRRPLF